MTEQIIFEQKVFIAAPIEKVWDAITKPELVSQYYLAPLGHLELKRGGQISYGTKDNQVINGSVLEVKEKSKLIHTFRFAHRADDPPSRVTYELESMEKMTLLILRHDNFSMRTATFDDIAGGWDIILSGLKTLLETGKPLPWPKSL